MRIAARQTFGVQWEFDRQNSDLPRLSWLQHLQGEAAARLEEGRLSVTPAYVFSRFDDRPGPGIHERYQFARIEAVLALDRGRHWLATGRAEHEHRTPNILSPGIDGDLGMMSLSWIPEPRLRVALEESSGDDITGSPRSRRTGIYVWAGW